MSVNRINFRTEVGGGGGGGGGGGESQDKRLRPRYVVLLPLLPHR